MLSFLGKNFSRWHFEIFFSYFSQKTGYDISCNLHEMSKPVSGKNKKNIIKYHLWSVESARKWKANGYNWQIFWHLFTRETTTVTSVCFLVNQSNYEKIFSKKKKNNAPFREDPFFVGCKTIFDRVVSQCVISPYHRNIRHVTKWLHLSHCRLNELTHTMVNVLKFRTLYSLLFWPKLCFLCTCFLKYLVEWQTV